MAGNTDALALVRVPTPAEEQKRILSRQREPLQGQVQPVAAQGRRLLLSQGYRDNKAWWPSPRWDKRRQKLPPWLVERLEVFGRVLGRLKAELDAATTALEEAALRSRSQRPGRPER